MSKKYKEAGKFNMKKEGHRVYTYSTVSFDKYSLIVKINPPFPDIIAVYQKPCLIFDLKIEPEGLFYYNTQLNAIELHHLPSCKVERVVSFKLPFQDKTSLRSKELFFVRDKMIYYIAKTNDNLNRSLLHYHNRIERMTKRLEIKEMQQNFVAMKCAGANQLFLLSEQGLLVRLKLSRNQWPTLVTSSLLTVSNNSRLSQTLRYTTLSVYLGCLFLGTKKTLKVVNSTTFREMEEHNLPSLTGELTLLKVLPSTDLGITLLACIYDQTAAGQATIYNFNKKSSSVLTQVYHGDLSSNFRSYGSPMILHSIDLQDRFLIVTCDKSYESRLGGCLSINFT